MDFDQKLLLLQSQLSRRYVYTASVTSGETSSLATGLPAKPQETITRIQFNIYINQSNLLGSLQKESACLLWGCFGDDAEDVPPDDAVECEGQITIDDA